MNASLGRITEGAKGRTQKCAVRRHNGRKRETAATVDLCAGPDDRPDCAFCLPADGSHLADPVFAPARPRHQPRAVGADLRLSHAAHHPQPARYHPAHRLFRRNAVRAEQAEFGQRACRDVVRRLQPRPDRAARADRCAHRHGADLSQRPLSDAGWATRDEGQGASTSVPTSGLRFSTKASSIRPPTA